MVDDKRLPLNCAFNIVWEALDQQRKQVNDLYCKITGGDKEILQRLLRMIDDVLLLCFSDRKTSVVAWIQRRVLGVARYWRPSISSQLLLDRPMAHRAAVEASLYVRAFSLFWGFN